MIKIFGRKQFFPLAFINTHVAHFGNDFDKFKANNKSSKKIETIFLS